MASVGITVTAGWRVSILMVTLGEDTIIFPAWKQTMTAKQLDEMNVKLKILSTSSSVALLIGAGLKMQRIERADELAHQ